MDMDMDMDMDGKFHIHGNPVYSCTHNMTAVGVKGLISSRIV